MTVDEAICPFRGRVHFRVYIKSKPHKYDVKVECVCESITGIVCNMEVYTAYGNNKVDVIVCRLLQPFEKKSHRVFMDRHYSSPTLFKQLLEKEFYPVGTVMSNRKYLPKEFSATDPLKKGEKIARIGNGNILATKWKDKRDVLTLSIGRNLCPIFVQFRCTRSPTTFSLYDTMDFYVLNSNFNVITSKNLQFLCNYLT